jgi:hypothetical protein
MQKEWSEPDPFLTIQYKPVGCKAIAGGPTLPHLLMTRSKRSQINHNIKSIELQIQHELKALS